MSAPGYTIGASSITVGSTSNWPSDTGVVFAIDEAEVVNGVEVQVPGTYNEYVGTVASGTSITNVSWALGTGDRNYAAGALTRVYIPVSATRENRIVDWGLAHANQDGTLKNNSVGTSQLTDKSVTLPKINGGSTAGVLATDASGNVAVGTKTVDANGWTVYDYGGWKEYAITKYWSAGTPAAAAVVSTTVPYPVGLSASNINSSSSSSHVITITTTGASTAELFNSVSSTRALAGSIELFIKNIHTAAQAFGSVTSHVRIIAK